MDICIEIFNNGCTLFFILYTMVFKTRQNEEYLIVVYSVIFFLMDLTLFEENAKYDAELTAYAEYMLMR